MHDSAKEYGQHLIAIKKHMGTDFQEFASYISNLLENTPEDATLRRRLPVHEWTLPYHMKQILPDGEKEYLLILGAEVKAQQRGMGYSAKEAHIFTPYFIMGAAQPEEGLGDPVGQRKAVGKSFDEYESRSRSVCAFALELLDRTKSKRKRNSSA